MVTIKELAEKTGVSRGTVDRVLHDRGRVSPEVKALVLKKAKELGYQPNRAGKILAARKQPHKIGVILPSEGNPFFADVIRGMKDADREYHDLGFSMEIVSVKGFDQDRHIAAIDELKRSGADAIVAATIDSHAMVASLENAGLPFSAVNSDLSSASRLCYVGPDYYGKGALHAGLMAIEGRKRGGILILKGSKDMKGHDDIIRGFRDTLEKRCVEAGIISEYETGDDDEKARMIVQRELSMHPWIDTLFVSTAGVRGAVEGADGKDDMLIFTSDDVASTRELIRNGRVQWTICQEPYRQGYESIRRMQDYLIDGRIPENLITENIVRIKENLLA